jgi:hypothetical protein
MAPPALGERPVGVFAARGILDSWRGNNVLGSERSGGAVFLVYLEGGGRIGVAEGFAVLDCASDKCEVNSVYFDL